MPSLDTMRPMTRSLCIAKNDFDGFAVRHGPGRVFYYILVYTVASLDTQCIDSNLESGRYITRVG